MTKPEPFLLQPAGKDYLWGGNRLHTLFGKQLPLQPLAETWECSTHPDGCSIVASGVDKGKSLSEVLQQHPEFLGAKTSATGDLPVLIKLIDAAKDLSVQVHPDDAYAQQYEHEPNGKTEMWYILEAEPEASLIYGFSKPMQPEQLAAVRLAMALYGGSVTSRLFLNVRERDHLCYYCSSSFQSFTGSMAVNSGVEHTDAARAEQAVLKELADLCDGPITDEELEDCRRGLLAGMNGLEDTLGGIETWYYMEVLRGGPVQTPDDARRALLAVTREDVRDILKQFTLSVSCLLTREEGNGNG